MAARRSEWPTNAARLGPSGRDSSAATYSRALDQVPCSSIARITCAAGDGLDPAEQVAGVDGARRARVDSEQEPRKIVVTPWRSDSLRSGSASTSTS